MRHMESPHGTEKRGKLPLKEADLVNDRSTLEIDSFPAVYKTIEQFAGDEHDTMDRQTVPNNLPKQVGDTTQKTNKCQQVKFEMVLGNLPGKLLLSSEGLAKL